MSKSSFVIELFERIHRLQFQNKRNEHLKGLKYKYPLLCLVFLLCIHQGYTHIYNMYFGPFHFNLNEFVPYWKEFNETASIERSYLSRLFYLDKCYLQIELGENKIDENPEHIFQRCDHRSEYERLLYTWNPIKEENITTFSMQLFINLPTNLSSHFHKRLPYRFELFNSDTLKCIAQQISIPHEVYHSSLKKSMHIPLIEEFYNHNATDFNMKVITKCGILLGYLDNYSNEIVLCRYSNRSYKVIHSVAVFNAYSTYSPYMTYLFSDFLLILCCCISFISIDFFSILWLVFTGSRLIISPDAQHSLNQCNIGSIQILDYLLMTRGKENNYLNQLFLVQDRYLIIFEIRLSEDDPKLLCKFYTRAPFIILDIANIIAITSDYISISGKRGLGHVPLPNINNAADWLHQRLMNCSPNLRQEQQRQYRLVALIDEEEEIQRINNQYDLERICNGSVSTSPRFIARFRLKRAQIVGVQLSETTCAICLDGFQLGDHYSSWSCPAQHDFHYNCMLNVLRRQNQCPLCRHRVEAANEPGIGVDS